MMIPARQQLLCGVAICLAAITPSLGTASPCSPWEWSNPSPQGNSLWEMEYGDGTFVGVGPHGTVMSSGDGEAWELRVSTTSEDLFDLDWGADRFVAVGSRGTIITSEDGETWAPAMIGTVRDLTAIAWNGSYFLAVSESWDVATSSDGLTWIVTEISRMHPTSLDWGAGLFVALWEERIVTSSDGLIWDEALDDAGEELNDIHWSGSEFIAVGDGGVVWLSEDGIDWREEHAGTSRDLFSVIWEFDRFVAVGRTGIVMSSIDGADWERWDSGSNHDLLAVCYGGEVFVAVGDHGATLTSFFAREWTAHSSHYPVVDLVDVAIGGDRLIAIPGDTSEVKAAATLYISEDSVVWERTVLPFQAEMRAIECAASQCVLVGDQAVVTGSVAAGWQMSTMAGVFFDGVSWDGTIFTAVGYTPDSGAPAIFTSDDGAVWADRSPAGGSRLYDVTSDGSMWVAVGANGVVFTSDDGSGWIEGWAGTPKAFFSVAWSGGRFVGVGERSLIASSDDGVHWTLSDPPTTFNLRKSVVTFTGVSAGAGRFVATGTDGAVVSSADGVSWAAEYVPTELTLTAAVPDGNRFIVIGAEGTVLRGTCPGSVRRARGRVGNPGP